jgi:glycosyltransferase involved in cell wall biosynthesis
MNGALGSADSVYFVMFGGWDDELRSNRWHYARRWAQLRPVVLVQPVGRHGQAAAAQPEPRIPNCEVLTIAGEREGYDFSRSLVQISQVLQHMRDRGHERPILWCYNPRLAPVYAAVPAVARVYHATENYFEVEGLAPAFLEQLRASLAVSDLVVAVSSGVMNAVAAHAGAARIAHVSNGCDGREYSPTGPSDSALAAAGSGFDRIAVFAGNINSRLDFELLSRVADANPRTLTATFGPVASLSRQDSETWRGLLHRENVRHFGAVEPERLPALYRSADLGVIPYRRTPWLVRNGFPLKALEMCATGLPTVSTFMEPIAELASALIVAPDDASFLAAFAETSRDRLTPAQQSELAAVCAANDYDHKFDLVVAELESVCPDGSSSRVDRFIAALGKEAWRALRDESSNRAVRPPRRGLRALLRAYAARILPSRLRAKLHVGGVG